MTREKQLECKRRYYQIHREEILAKQKIHRQNRTPEQKQRDKEYHREYYRKWVKEHPNRISTRPRKCEQENTVYTYFELTNPELFNGTYNGCSEYSDCLTCPRERCIYD